MIASQGKVTLKMYLTLLVILISSRNPVSGQTKPDASYVPGQPDEGRLMIREESLGGLYQLSPEDSLSLMLLDIEIEKARAQTDQTAFWHRLIPEIRLVASIGVRDVFFIDPVAYVPYVWPTDTYRIAGSISLSGVFDSGKHTLANLELSRLRIQRSKLLGHFRSQASSLAAKRVALQNEISLTEEEIGLLQILARYTDLLFQQGEAKYDALIRSKLQLLGAQKNLERLTLQVKTIDSQPPAETDK